MFWLADHYLSDEIDKSEQLANRGSIVLEVDLTGMNGVVANDAHDIECLLNTHIKAARHQMRNVVVDIFTLPAEAGAQLLRR